MTDTTERVWLVAPNGDRSWVHPPTPFAQQPSGRLDSATYTTEDQK